MSKKLLSLLLALLMVCSLGAPALAEEPTVAPAGNDWQNGTAVSYKGTADEEYFLIVPTTMAPGGTDTVTLKGTWASNRQMTAIADASVTMTDNLGTTQTLAVTFPGITLAGNNETAVSKDESISVGDITALFGEWSGTFYYNVQPGDATSGGDTAVSYDATFANNSWEAIATACQNDEVPATWAVGDTKTMSIDGKEYKMRIVGKKHDDYTDGSGKAPLTIGLAECYDWGVMNDTATNVGGWKESQMRTVTLPAILEKMPAEVQSAIKAVDKLGGVGNESEDIETVSDKLFLFAAKEVGYNPTTAIKNDGTAYEFFASGSADCSMPALEGNSDSTQWWYTRSVSITNSTSFYATAGGISSNRKANIQSGIVFGFCF